MRDLMGRHIPRFQPDDDRHDCEQCGASADTRRNGFWLCGQCIAGGDEDRRDADRDDEMTERAIRSERE